MARICIGAWVWIIGFGLLSSYLPQIHWHGTQIKIAGPSTLVGRSFKDRLQSQFYRWDAVHYTNIASQGYKKAGGGEYYIYAFFPGYPILLKGLLILGVPIAWLSFAASLLNLLLWGCSLRVWLCLLSETSLFKSQSTWQVQGQNKFTWLYLFYPTALFCIAPYPESLFLSLSGSALLACVRNQPWLLFFSLFALLWVKHIGLAVGLALVLWTLIWKRQLAVVALSAYVLGLASIFAFFYYETQNAWIWLHAQTNWDRKFSWPHELFFATQGGKGLDLYLYILIIFLVPALMLRRFIQKSNWQSSSDTLMFAYLGAIYTPIWFGGNNMSTYRIVYLVPYVIAYIVLALRGPVKWRLTQGLALLLGWHAIYKFVVGLRLP